MNFFPGFRSDNTEFIKEFLFLAIRRLCFFLPKEEQVGYLATGSAWHKSAVYGGREQTTTSNVTQFVNILEFGYYIWKPYEKCIQKSPNMPGIGSLIRETDVRIVRNLMKANKLLFSNTSSSILSVKILDKLSMTHSK